MMRHHLDTVRERGEPISALWAAEPAIYGRFGYGAATTGCRLTLPRGAAMVDVAGSADLHVRFETADADAFADVVDSVQRQAARTRPGAVTRESDGLRRGLFGDRRAHRGRDAEPLRLLLVEDAAGTPRGYALFTRASVWSDTGPAGTVSVREAVALDAAASRLLWGRLADLDLSVSVQTDSRPHDDPLLLQLLDLRAAAPRVTDGTWVRVVDVGAAFSGRTCAAEVDVVVEVADTWCPWNAGRWRIAGGPDGTRCTRTRQEADLRLGAAALGSVLVGGRTLTALHAAGLAEAQDPAVLARASAALASPVAPHCGWLF
jgi:predicted acetyltransferase